uniref:MORN repeat-containing protein n=1 Tax=Pyrodinium bahamense TaxID=73915 RepID=A0A7S0FG56_9DINO|mmetsp:Transcript_30496/g.84130  ORF Transcript_30496/g.84130 Transcript_30496/m.84130 type:complete len:345 (+) Transcript_30496:2-1036(+)
MRQRPPGSSGRCPAAADACSGAWGGASCCLLPGFSAPPPSDFEDTPQERSRSGQASNNGCGFGALAWCTPRSGLCSAGPQTGRRDDIPTHTGPDNAPTPDEQGSNGAQAPPADSGKKEHEQTNKREQEAGDTGADSVETANGHEAAESEPCPAGGLLWTPADALLDVTHPNYREVQCKEGVYRGQVQPGGTAFDGYGCLESNGSILVGYWREGRMHGDGSQSWTELSESEDQPRRCRYVGQFLEGAFSGHGRMQWQHPRGPMVYEGQYRNDKKHGEGRFTWPSGKAYEGQWASGQRHGVGVDVNPGGAKCLGIWEDNVFVRPLIAADQATLESLKERTAAELGP